VKQANIGAASGAPVRVPRWAYPAVTVMGLLLGAEAIVRGTRAVVSIADSDLTNFFFRSADYILRGDPWHMYAVRASGAYPNYNPPLSIALMAPLLALARAVGFANNYGEIITFICIPFLVFVPLLGYLVLRVLRHLYPEMPEAQQLIAYGLILLSPLTWQTYGTWYHIEQPMMLCLLVGAVLAVQQRREALGGVLAGLAVMTRTTALIPLIALGLLLLFGGQWRALFKLAGAAAVVVAVVMAPFFFFDRADTVYSFLTWRGTAPIGGNSIWSIFASGNTTGLRHTLDMAARRLDMPSVILFVLVATYLAVRAFRITAYSREAWAILTIAALAVPMLSKTNWPYYYLEPFVPMLVWEFTSMYDRRSGVWRWPVLSLSYLAITATLSQYIGLQSVGFLDRVGVGFLDFAAMLAFVLLIWFRLQAVKPSPADAIGSVYGRSPGSLGMSPSGGPIMSSTAGTPERASGAPLPGVASPSPAQAPRSVLVSPPRTTPAPKPPVESPPSAVSWPNLSPAPSSDSPSFGPVGTSGRMYSNTPPWQPNGLAGRESALPPVPEQWPDLRPPQSPTGPGQ
jgi:hypothetical protein